MADFSVALREELKQNELALPDGFNSDRFVQNGVALLNNNDTLLKFCKEHKDGVAQVKQGMMRGAFLGLDFLNQEAYLIPYGSKLDYQTSYVGEIKLRKKYSTRPIKDIYAKVVRQGDEYEETIIDGKQGVHFKPLPFNSGEIIGAFAVCLFEDGGILIDSMSKAEVEKSRSASKAKNSPAWNTFYEQMVKKTVLRRLCKSIDMDLNATQRTTLDEEMALETDPIERRNADVESEANTEEFIDADAVEVVDDQIGGQMSLEDIQ